MRRGQGATAAQGITCTLAKSASCRANAAKSTSSLYGFVVDDMLKRNIVVGWETGRDNSPRLIIYDASPPSWSYIPK